MGSDGMSCFQQETHLKYWCVPTAAAFTVTQPLGLALSEPFALLALDELQEEWE